MNPERRHLPVLLSETLKVLEPARLADRESWWLDGTLGLGGHAKALLELAGPRAHLLGMDKDPQALELAAQTLSENGTRVRLLHGSFAGLVDEARGFPPPGQGFDGILLDLGVSSLQLDSPERGFSFQRPGPLDMRMDTSQGETAADWLARVDEVELTQTLKDLGEEPKARAIARSIKRSLPLAGTLDLVAAVEKVTGGHRGGAHPATRTFQALRIAVNHEIGDLEEALPKLISLLRQGGRLAIISFHSLEDRPVKRYFQRESSDCICPPGLPECRCGHRASLKDLLKGGQPPSAEEIEANPRSRSARLRAVEKL